ncbi:hypothetical protein HYH02_014448 [Chlamydomonas schloesseri]|uniref:Uncharacterized protein n=1 Tax=Chlamydomonas schloesseri TaxID=2026947 RepID=A0A835SWH5_9CHLO|nr:hypothetical protein HYH02_014448 [Chlamydomonas schloesseri]|eukprot:KAG2428100.1 hypothetical protein HYH02_014448 [Chlamydomonas schloesseri]
MLQELSLVAVEVLGRALSHVSHQVLLMLVAFLTLAVINMACAPVKSRVITLLDFVSLAVLCLTLTLSMYFVVDSEDLSPTSEDVIGFIIMAMNVALLAAFLVLVAHKTCWSKAKAKAVSLAQKAKRCFLRTTSSRQGSKAVQELSAHRCSVWHHDLAGSQYSQP